MKESHTIVISDSGKDLFRVHFYEDCIKFDIKFAEGISKNIKVCKEIIKINEKWGLGKINQKDVLETIVILMENHIDEFKEYYFKEYELNISGKYIDLIPIDSLSVNMGEHANSFYEYLVSENVLKEIDKKEFEKNLRDEEYQNLYLDLYSQINGKKTKYYQYRLNANFDRKMCNIISLEKEVVFGYVF
jgi:hypothetical protein